MRCVHTSAGNRWRSGLRRPDGSLPERARSLETEREFWRRRVQAGLPPPDDYAVPVLAALLELAEAAGVSSVLEIGPGWGNYTLPLCRRFDRVACVDLSPDNLRWLSRAAEAEGLLGGVGAEPEPAVQSAGAQKGTAPGRSVPADGGQILHRVFLEK